MNRTERMASAFCPRSVWTRHNGSFCISDMENSGILTAFKRLADSDKCSFDKIAVIRTASNYVYEPNTAPVESIRKHDYFNVAVENTYRAIKAIMNEMNDKS